ncbi:hypothetical protein [Novosphingobium album (ex Hu et al. 2023)]|uniref:Uncharacterized protein n=1 Tax=Novosphingobium album (ex Hu et al. 2023) TaxID=2930093 RepID=A0ABT0B0P3_9SPHN|nr:hypothetical protein [Novosphingobium album (ex Hu et al. 2023)]MCJ2178595.1 hypothetical protein [Novosphingobium album (ex Hu et al. 2023)]
MLLTLRQMKSGATPHILLDKKVSGKFYREQVKSKVTKGFHINKTGRLLELHFVSKMEGLGQVVGHLSFTEFEIFQMAKWSRRGKSDEEFLEAIMKQD